MEQKLIKSEIESRIFIIRGKQVMFDRDLARLYNVQTRVLNQTVKRNANRFPEQFMFQLSSEEFGNWKSQIVTSNSEKMGLRKLPYVFTEYGVAMLSGVLNSEIALNINIEIIQTFIDSRASTNGYFLPKSNLRCVHLFKRIDCKSQEIPYSHRQLHR